MATKSAFGDGLTGRIVLHGFIYFLIIFHQFSSKFGTKEAAHLQLHEFCVANQIRAHPKSSEIEDGTPKGDSKQKEVDQNDDSSNEALIKDDSDKGSDQGKAQQQQLSMLTPMAAVDPHEQLDKAANKKRYFEEIFFE